MFTEEKMHEVEDFIKDEKHRLSVENFATISGIRGKQFGKEIFSTVIKFRDLREFIEAFSEVQRNLIVPKVNSIKNYVLSGLETANPMRFFPAITVTARGHIFYDEQSNRLAIDTRNSKLSINDGQHRFMGVSEAIRTIEGKINKTKDEEEKFLLKGQLAELNNMVMPVVIFNNLTLAEERQLFTDTNNLSQRPSRSATIRLAQTDLYAKMSRELAEENKYMIHYGVEMDKNSIYGKDNHNTILLTTIYASIKTLVKGLDKQNFESNKLKLMETFNRIFQVLPGDLNVRGKYITDQNYCFKGINKFIADCRNKQISEDIIFETIGKVNWASDVKYWKKFGAMTSKTGKLVFGSSGDHGRYAVYHALKSYLPREAAQLELLND